MAQVRCHKKQTFRLSGACRRLIKDCPYAKERKERELGRRIVEYAPIVPTKTSANDIAMFVGLSELSQVRVRMTSPLCHLID